MQITSFDPTGESRRGTVERWSVRYDSARYQLYEEDGEQWCLRVDGQAGVRLPLALRLHWCEEASAPKS